jgi:hypothetical protein
MRSCVWPRLALGLALVGASGASATDYWDASVVKDNSAIETYNEMYHGVSQQHDLQANAGPVADEDWSFILSNEFSSYEAIIDSTSADIDTSVALTFQRFAADGTSVIQQSEAANVGAPVTTNRALRWGSGDPFALTFLRVRSGGCTTTCSAAAQYRIRFYETTITVPRFNNGGGQVTVLIVQNATTWTRNIGGVIHFWSPSGTELGVHGLSLAARAALVLNTSTVPAAAGQAGTITIDHNGGYGGLSVKAVALEPTTGFSFDSPGLYKPQ